MGAWCNNINEISCKDCDYFEKKNDDDDNEQHLTGTKDNTLTEDIVKIKIQEAMI